MKTKIASMMALALVSMILVGFVSANQDGWNVPEKYQKMKNPVAPAADNIEAGKVLYNKHCKSCHGAKGYADGPKAANLEATMRSLASKEYKAQADGVKYYKSFVGKDEMPNFEKKILDEKERWSIINYMETLK